MKNTSVLHSMGSLAQQLRCTRQTVHRWYHAGVLTARFRHGGDGAPLFELERVYSELQQAEVYSWLRAQPAAVRRALNHLEAKMYQ